MDAKYFSDNYKFYPDVNLRNFWLHTRKKTKRYTTFELPGMFHTYNYNLDSIAFIIVLVLEIWGFINLTKVMNLSFGAKCGLVLGGILVDIAFAVFSHWNTDKICKARNICKLLEFKDITQIADTVEGHKELNSDGQTRFWEHKIKYWKRWSLFFQICIGFLAFLKWKFFIANNTNPINANLNLVMTVVYIIIAFIHIVSTGYFIAETRLRLMFRKQRIIFETHKINSFQLDEAKHIQEETITPTKAGTVIKNFNNTNPPDLHLKHTIAVNQNSFNLITRGLITDEDLNSMTLLQNQQNGDAEKEIALRLLSRQYKQLN